MVFIAPINYRINVTLNTLENDTTTQKIASLLESRPKVLCELIIICCPVDQARPGQEVGHKNGCEREWIINDPLIKLFAINLA